MSIGYNEQPQFQFDIEHPATAVEFGVTVALNGTSTQSVYIYGVNPEVTKLGTPATGYAESYILTLPPVTEGHWTIEAESNFGVSTETYKFLISLPQNPQLVPVIP